MEIQQLKGFLAVAKFRNFTVAARKTLRTQPTISLQVKSLEEELGVKLFERLGPKKVTLTQEGQMLVDIVGPLIDEFDHVTSKFNEKRGIFSASTVRVLTHRSVMVHLLPSVVKKFKQKFPDCQLSILNRSRGEMVTMLNDGEADIGISSLHPVPQGLHYEVVSKYNRILIATKGHPLSKKEQITLKDIAQYPLILPHEGYNTRAIIDNLFKEKGLKYQLAMEVVGRDAIKTYVEMNLGISIINEYYLTAADKSRLFVKDMSRYFGKAETGIIYRKGKDLSTPVEEFIKLIHECNGLTSDSTDD